MLVQDWTITMTEEGFYIDGWVTCNYHRLGLKKGEWHRMMISQECSELNILKEYYDVLYIDGRKVHCSTRVITCLKRAIQNLGG